MNLTARRVNEFARLLESGARTDEPSVAPMVAVASALQQIPSQVTPRPEFRAQLRQRLMAVAAVQPAEAGAESPMAKVREATRTWRVQRRMVAVAAGAAAVTAFAGVGVGATKSLPGQPFYGVKKAAEGVQLATTFGTEDRGKQHLAFARARLAEVEALAAGRSSALGPAARTRILATDFVADSGASSLILSTLRAMDVQTREGANDLFEAFGGSGSNEPLRALDRFTTKQYAELHTLLPSLPASVQPRAQSSLSLLQLVHADTAGLAQTSSPTTGPSTSQATPATSGSASPAPSSATSSPGASTEPSKAPGPGIPALPTGKATPPVGVPSIPATFSPPVSPLPTSLTTVPLPDLSELPGVLGH